MEKKQIDGKLGLIVFGSAKNLGAMVDAHLMERYNLNPSEFTSIIPIKENFFEDGHLKVEIKDSVRGKDVYLLTDIGNYSVTYKIHGHENYASPNDLMMQLKDGIGACNCHASNINVVMPLMYAGRQHRRISRESLACGRNLHELEMAGVKRIITFDVHDPSVEHAVYNMEFDNFFATNPLLEQFINNASAEELEKIVFIAPDNGATGRRNVYLNSFNSERIHREAGSFYKQRDYNNFVDGKYPILSHDYCGNNDLEGKTAIVSDDIISSGASMFDVIEELNERGIKNIYIICTYALFTKGIEGFEKYYQKGMLSGLYTTNLSYIPDEFLNCPWLHICDCSSLMADIIYNLHNEKSISNILRDRSYPVRLLEKKFYNK